MPAEAALERSRLLLWNVELFYAFSLASAKLAILGFYWRMFKTSNLKRPIQVLVGCTIIWTTLRVCVSCHPLFDTTC
jgi:predicted neutral ceramidase superfamily lipid hydrolase